MLNERRHADDGERSDRDPAPTLASAAPTAATSLAPATPTEAAATATAAATSPAGLLAGTVLAWGDDSKGQTESLRSVQRRSDIRRGRFAIALKSDGTVVGWARMTPASLRSAGLSGVVEISAGSSHAID